MHFSEIKHNSCYFEKFGGKSLVAVLASGKQKNHEFASFCQVQKVFGEKIILEKSLFATTEILFHFPASMLVHTRGLLYSSCKLVKHCKKKNLFMINCFCCIKPLASLLNSNWVSQEQKKSLYFRNVHPQTLCSDPTISVLALFWFKIESMGLILFTKMISQKLLGPHIVLSEAKECQQDSARVSVCTYLCAYMNFTMEYLSLSLQLKRLCFQVCFFPSLRCRRF